jgi:hypothetical protein
LVFSTGVLAAAFGRPVSGEQGRRSGLAHGGIEFGNAGPAGFAEFFPAQLLAGRVERRWSDGLRPGRP